MCSQVYSQHPSHSEFPDVRQHRYGAPSNAEVRCQEPETKEANWVGNTHPDCQFLSSKGHACSGYADFTLPGAPSNAEVCCQAPATMEANCVGNTSPNYQLFPSKGVACSGHADFTSPFKSSWIQRLIRSHNAGVEQPQPSEKSNKENYHVDGLQTNWKENAGELIILGNHSNFPVYENSRRSKEDFFSSRQTYLGTNTPEFAQNGVNIGPFETSNALPPEVQVSPKPLPIVESLLPGHSKKGAENQTSTETNMPHILSRCMGLANPMKQTVHCSADKKCRVSCSSIEGLNSYSVVRAAGDLLTLNSSQMVDVCIGPSRPSSEFSFSRVVAISQSIMDLTYAGEGMQSGTNLRTHMNSTQIEDPLIISLPETRYCDLHKDWASSMARRQSIENRMSAGYSMPHREEPIETDEGLPHGLSMDQLPSTKTISKRTSMNPKEHWSYAHDGYEALYARDSSCEIGWRPIANTEKDDLGQISDLVPLYAGATVAKEKAGTSLSHCVNEQDLGSLHGSREEPGGTSRSFSFHFENRFASELDHAKAVTRKGQWPFSRFALSNDLAESRWAEDNRARGLAEATRPGLCPETGVCEAETAYIGRSQASPIFGMARLNDSSSGRIFNNHTYSPYKAACIDIGGVFTGETKTLSLPGNSVDQAGQTLQGGHPLTRLESNLMIEGMERKELRLPFPSRTVSEKNWKAFRPSIPSTTRKCAPEGACSVHADGNCVSTNNWKAFKPPNRRGIYTRLPEDAQSNHADGGLCYSIGSIGSCSKRPLDLSGEDASTSANARSRSIAEEKPSVALQKQLHGSQRWCTGSGVNIALDDRESEGNGAIGWRASGFALKQNTWLQRWSSTRPRKIQAFSRANSDGRALAGTTHARNYTKKDYYMSHDSGESSHGSDRRPAKRICYETRSGLHPGNAISQIGSFAMEREHTEKGVISHFMKRFFTPSAAAMAIMGMTARTVHATQSQRSSLFGDWVSNASARKRSGSEAEVCKDFLTRKPSGSQAKACKEFSPRTNGEKEILQSATQVPPTHVDL